MKYWCTHIWIVKENYIYKADSGLGKIKAEGRIMNRVRKCPECEKINPLSCPLDKLIKDKILICVYKCGDCSTRRKLR